MTPEREQEIRATKDEEYLVDPRVVRELLAELDAVRAQLREREATVRTLELDKGHYVETSVRWLETSNMLNKALTTLSGLANYLEDEARKDIRAVVAKELAANVRLVLAEVEEAVLAPPDSAEAITAGAGAYLRWREAGDSSPSNLVHAILNAALAHRRLKRAPAHVVHGTEGIMTPEREQEIRVLMDSEFSCGPIYDHPCHCSEMRELLDGIATLRAQLREREAMLHKLFEALDWLCSEPTQEAQDWAETVCDEAEAALAPPDHSDAVAAATVSKINRHDGTDS